MTETLDLPLPLRIGASANSSADALALLIALGVVARFHQIAADSASSAYQLDPSSGDALMASDLLHAAQHLQLSSNQKLLTPIQFGPEAERTQQNCTNPTSGCSCTDHAAVQAQMLIEWKDISARLAKLAAEGFRRQAEIATVKETIAKLEATIPMAQTRMVDFKKLVDQGYISSHATQDKTRERVELERDLGKQ